MIALTDNQRQRLQDLGLDPELVAHHMQLIRHIHATGSKPCFKVQDTLRLDNGGILPLPETALAKSGSGYAAFIPAAGAASRYAQPFAALIGLLERAVATAGSQQAAPEKLPGDVLAAAQAQVEALAKAGARDWPLPSHLRQLLAAPDRAIDLTAADCSQLLAELQRPKALLPCVRDGLTFLAMKHREHRVLPDVGAEVFVTPPGLEEEFAAQLGREVEPSTFPIRFLAQGPALSTLRLRPDGSLYTHPDGSLAPVPAGHGALTRLFPDVRKLLPQAEGLFIRNIDNVMGASTSVLTATRSFLGLHRLILAAVKSIRQALTRGDMGTAADAAARLLSTLFPKDPAASGNAADILLDLQRRLFHSPGKPPKTRGEPLRAELIALYGRPVNLLGQVPNTGKDVGGTPCLIDGPKGPAKVCLELPHASPEDQKTYFANPARATHFNPVFVAAELSIDDVYGTKTGDYWLLSEKLYRGEPVVYVETVLYELLGNSDLANCAFVEVPRDVFNPHKTMADAKGRDLKSWLGA